jgi:hypothetical protein
MITCEFEWYVYSANYSIFNLQLLTIVPEFKSITYDHLLNLNELLCLNSKLDQPFD